MKPALARLTVLTLAVPVALAAAPVATAVPNGSWLQNQPLASPQAVLGGTGLALAVAEWVDTSPDTDHPQMTLRVRRSTDDGRTFSDPIDAPATAERGKAGAVALTTYGDQIYVASAVRIENVDRLRIDRLSVTNTWLSSVLPDSGFCQPADAPPLIATRGQTVVAADACAHLWRSKDNGATYAALPGPATGALTDVATQSLTATGSGFVLLLDASSDGGTRQLFRRVSTDDGQTFGELAQLTSSGFENVGASRVARDEQNGTLLAATHVLTDPDRTDIPSRLRLEVRRSLDDGQTWSDPTVVHTGVPSATGTEGVVPLPSATDAGFELVALTYGTGSWGRWHSDDGGTSFRTMAAPPAVAATSDVAASVVGGTRIHLLRDGSYTHSVAAPNPPAVYGIAQTASTVTIAIASDNETTGLVVRWAAGAQAPATVTDGNGAYDGPTVRSVTLSHLPAGSVSISVFARGAPPAAGDGPSMPTQLVLRASTTTIAPLTSPSTVTKSGTVRKYRLGIRLADGVTPPLHTIVELWGRVAGTNTWRKLADARNSGGTVSIAPTATMVLQARAPGSLAVRYSTGPMQVAPVAPLVKAALSTTSTRLRRAVTLRTSVSPAHPGRVVSLQRYSGGAWRTIATRTLSSSSTAIFTVPTTSRGRFNYRIAMSAHTDHALGVSPTVVLSVT